MILTCLIAARFVTILAADFHVATNGQDGWSGTLASPDTPGTDGPFRSLARAQRAVRELKQTSGLPDGGLTVHVGPGAYRFTTALQFTDADSGTEESPVRYLARPGEVVRLSGGEVLSNFTPVADPEILQRLDPAARGHVLQSDLRTLGLTDFGTAAGGGLELFFQDRPMPIARWPNEGFVRMVEVLGATPVDVRGTKGCVEGLFKYEGDRPRRWIREPDVWLHGYWFWDWSDQRQQLEALDVEHQTIELAAPYHNYGYRNGQWYYAYNLLSEIDQPGEWHLDRHSGILYFWPPAPIQNAAAMVSISPTLIVLENVSHFTLRGFILEATRDTALIMSGGTANRIVGCTIRNVGGAALRIAGGSNHGVVGCDIYQCGAGGLALEGGDRRNLTAAGHFAENNQIHHYGRWRPMYSAGISLSGVGNRARHNLIHNAPHQAISFGGNDHLMEFNEIHSVCHESNDAGAIYSGRDWTMRGTVIRHNYLHHIQGFEGRGCVGIYLDDMYSGTEIYGNLFYRVRSAAFIGGGRDCTIENNVFVDCDPAVHVDARAMGWAKYHADDWVKEAHEKGTLSGTRFKEPPYSTRYPTLPGILTDDPWAPKGNRIARNICAGGRWDNIEGRARPLITFQDNLIDPDPGFVDRAARNFQLEDSSPAWNLGFKRIPVERIGLYQADTRASWPVHHEPRILPAPGFRGSGALP
jgi:hypothetical protein